MRLAAAKTVGQQFGQQFGTV